MASIVKKIENTRKPWTVRYQADGRQREKSFQFRWQAQEFRARFEHEHREGSYIDPQQGSITFGEYAAKWLDGHICAPSTKSSYRSALDVHIVPAIGAMPLRKITREHLTDLLAGLPNGTSAKVRVVLVAVLGEAVKARRITATPAHGLRIPAASQRAQFTMPTPAQLDALTEAMPESLRFTVPLMAGCGLRIGEALAVRSEDFNGRLRITGQIIASTGLRGPLKHRKDDDYRDIPIPAWVTRQRPQGSGDLFPRVSRAAYRGAFGRARKAAGLPADFTPHALRHVFASVALSEGVPITDVAKWLGHSSINVTFAIYGHLVPSAWDRAVTALDKWHDS